MGGWFESCELVSQVVKMFEPVAPVVTFPVGVEWVWTSPHTVH
jgi:hypothetical protein